jgi:hypothetical protein
VTEGYAELASTSFTHPISESSIFVKKSWIITILKYQVCLDQFLHLPSHTPRTPCHYNSRIFQRLDLLLRSPAAPADNGTGMAHGIARRRLYPINYYGKVI